MLRADGLRNGPELAALPTRVCGADGVMTRALMDPVQNAQLPRLDVAHARQAGDAQLLERRAHGVSHVRLPVRNPAMLFDYDYAYGYVYGCRAWALRILRSPGHATPAAG